MAEQALKRAWSASAARVGCSLRRLGERDATAFFAYRRHPDVARFQTTLTEDEEAARRFLRRMAVAELQDDEWLQLAIVDDGDALIGDVGLRPFDELRQIEVGMTLAPRVQGRGLSLTAGTLLLRELFERHEVHRVIAIADVRNDASLGTLRAMGLRMEGRFVAASCDPRTGEWGDEVSWAILRDEWLRRVDGAAAANGGFPPVI